jgi:hypothetical protein
MLRKLILLLILITLWAIPSFAKTKVAGIAQKGGLVITTSPTVSYKTIESYPNSTITVYLTGTTTLATIYSDNVGTVKANPFTTNSDASFSFYIDNVRYDMKFSGTGIATPFTLTDLVAFDPVNPSAPPITNYVLNLNGDFQFVNFAKFWKGGNIPVDGFWEFWAYMPVSNSGKYFVSEGYGGAHCLLLGIASHSSESGSLFGGNVFSDISTHVDIGSDEGPEIGEWFHGAVGFDDAQNEIIIYSDGVPVGATPYTASVRYCQQATMFWGGSDHQNGIFRLSQVRGWEGFNPHSALFGNDLDRAAFVPATLFSPNGTDFTNATQANFMVDFLQPNLIVPDKSAGYDNNEDTDSLDNNRKTHSGILMRNDSLGDPKYYGVGSTKYPLPLYTIDTTAPTYNYPNAPTIPVVNVPTPLTVPTGARLFDSFNRRNKTFAFNEEGGLDDMEGGSEGMRTWHYNNGSGNKTPFGIYKGKAVNLENYTKMMAFVSTNSTNNDIRVDRRANSSWQNGVSTSILFRVSADGGSYCYAYTVGNATNNQLLTVSCTSTGDLATGIACPASWTTLRVITKSNGTLQVYADATSLYSTTNGSLSGNNGLGIIGVNLGTGLRYRWDNFTVYEAP